MKTRFVSLIAGALLLAGLIAPAQGAEDAVKFRYFEHGGVGPITVSITGVVDPVADLKIPAQIMESGRSLTVIGISSAAFRGTGVTSVTLPDSVRTIGDNAFADNQISSPTLGNGLTTIGDQAFQNNKLTALMVPGSVMTCCADFGQRI